MKHHSSPQTAGGNPGLPSKEVCSKDWVDVGGMDLDVGLSPDQRRARVLEQVKNPHCFRVGGMGVMLDYSPEGPCLQEAFTDYLIRLKREH